MAQRRCMLQVNFEKMHPQLAEFMQGAVQVYVERTKLNNEK